MKSLFLPKCSPLSSAMLPALLLACLAVSLVGCSGSRPHDVRIHASARDQFYVDRHFEEACQGIVAKLDECASGVKEKEINPLAGSARLQSGRELLVELFRIDNDHTRVDVYAQSRSRMDLVRHGALGEAGCPR